MAKEESVANSTTEQVSTEAPKVRHEFVGMMFALAIGEVGIQVASIVRHDGSIHEYLPAYTHLILAIVVIAASWVGWSLSVTPGARRDVTGIFQTGFFVLLTDVALVICYFVLARSVEFQKSESAGSSTFKASAAPAALWVLWIFILYILWDVLTKIVDRDGNKGGSKTDTDSASLRNSIVRIVPTVFCTLLAWWAFLWVSGVLQPSQVVVADIALLMLVLLFRAGKDVASAFWPSKGKHLKPPLRSVILAVSFLLAFVSALCCAHFWPITGLDDFILNTSVQPQTQR